MKAMESQRIYEIHERLGFPPISEKDQADILIWHDVGIINKLTPGFEAEFIPPAVAKQYVKLTKEKFRELFIVSGYIERLYEKHLEYPRLDSEWVEKTEDSKYQLKVQERGGLVHLENFEDYDRVIDYFVNWMYRVFDQ
jgi:hypothetical protein